MYKIPEKNYAKIKDIEEQFEKPIREKTMGNILWSKSAHYELGEKKLPLFSKNDEENIHIKMLIDNND